MITCREVHPDQVPISLLKEADPSEDTIRRYLTHSLCFTLQEDDTILAVCVVEPDQNGGAEIHNISVHAEQQKRGLGTRLLKFALERLQETGIKTVSLGTGTFGHQLTFYQRLDFRVESVIKDYFLDNYAEPIFENGLQHKDMLRLKCHLD